MVNVEEHLKRTITCKDCGLAVGHRDGCVYESPVTTPITTPEKPLEYDYMAVLETGLSVNQMEWGDIFAAHVYEAMCRCSDQPNAQDILGIALADAKQQGLADGKAREAALLTRLKSADKRIDMLQRELVVERELFHQADDAKIMQRERADAAEAALVTLTAQLNTTLGLLADEQNENATRSWPRVAELAIELGEIKKVVTQTINEMHSAVELSKQFGTPVADHQLITDWENQLAKGANG